MRREERQTLLREHVSRPETARDRRDLAGLAEDLRSSPLRDRPLPLRLRNFRPDAGGYLASLSGPLPYMQRLREIDERTAEHERELRRARQELLRAQEEIEPLEDRWRTLLERWSFDEVNDLIARHNRWYPIEARVAMDPETGGYALVNGRDHRLDRLDAEWVLERFPPVLRRAVVPIY